MHRAGWLSAAVLTVLGAGAALFAPHAGAAVAEARFVAGPLRDIYQIPLPRRESGAVRQVVHGAAVFEIQKGAGLPGGVPHGKGLPFRPVLIHGEQLPQVIIQVVHLVEADHLHGHLPFPHSLFIIPRRQLFSRGNRSEKYKNNSV